MHQNFKTLELAILLHKKVAPLEIPFYQKEQLQRASQSIALNLSEGAGRFTSSEKKRFYRIAFGSLRETQTILKMLELKDEEILALADKTAASLYKLIKAL